LSNLFGLTNKIWIERDLERYYKLKSALEQDMNCLFRYKFDRDKKEDYYISEEKRKEVYLKNYKQKKR